MDQQSKCCDSRLATQSNALLPVGKCTLYATYTRYPDSMKVASARSSGSPRVDVCLCAYRLRIVVNIYEKRYVSNE